MQVSTATDQGVGIENEDAVFTAPGFIAVLDGVSAPKDLPMACIHGTSWFVSNLGSSLVTQASAKGGRTLREALALSIEHVNELHQNTCDLTQIDVPSSTVALVRLTDETVEYLVLSDALVVFDTISRIEVVMDQSVESVATQERDAVHRHPTGTPQHARLLDELVRTQRRLRNQPSGYWVASTAPEAAQHAVTGAMDLSEVRAIAVMTDGAARLMEDFGVMSWRDAFDVLADGGPGELIRRTRAIEASDPAGERWPRYKDRDDATVAYCIPEGAGS